ncbi:MAG: hypothetical protein ACOYON_13660 [Fimbriimonas sp.]
MQRRLLVSFLLSEKTFRAVKALGEDSGLAGSEVQHQLATLLELGLVDQVQRPVGIRFYLTREGRLATNSLGPELQSLQSRRKSREDFSGPKYDPTDAPTHVIKGEL